MMIPPEGAANRLYESTSSVARSAGTVDDEEALVHHHDFETSRIDGKRRFRILPPRLRAAAADLC
jgi:hypothetical protein